MNDEKRAELVETINTELMRAQGEYGQDHYFFGASSDRIMSHVDRLLAGERKRIRDKLLDPVMFNEEFIGQLAVILDFIGITEESTHGPE